MTTPPPPTPEEQVLFLRNIQRLLSEGQFTASYKLALLHATADLCVLQGEDSGDSLELSVKDIAEKCVELYWQQCRPFEIGGQSTGLVLLQNKGRQAAIVRKIITAQEDFGGSLFRLKQTAPDLWNSLTGDVTRTVKEMPLWKLQTVGSERMDFLYENLDRPVATVTLKPGIAFCFRAFYGLLRDLIQGAWVRFVQQVNANELGNLTDLGSFLFDRERSTLNAYRAVLLDFQAGGCFYCRKGLKAKSDVDHFVPWSRYPTDLTHNFVLAHAVCNNAKSDFLAAEPHLACWTDHNVEKLAELNEDDAPASSKEISEVAAVFLGSSTISTSRFVRATRSSMVSRKTSETMAAHTPSQPTSKAQSTSRRKMGHSISSSLSNGRCRTGRTPRISWDIGFCAD